MSIGDFVDWKLIAIFIVASLAFGVIIGLLVNEATKLKARINPETFQFLDKGDYVSIGSGKDLPERNSFLFLFLNAFKDDSFVIVKSEPQNVISETFYNQLGDSVKVTYRDNKCIRTEYPSSPMYTINCFIPLVGGFFCGLVIPALLYQLGIEETSGFGIVVNEVLYYGIHLFLAGLISYLTFYVIPSWISLFNRTSQSQA